MAYTPPNFNLAMDWWIPGTLPAGGPAAVLAVPTQLYYASRVTYIWDFVLLPNVLRETEIRVPKYFVGLAALPWVNGIFGVQDGTPTWWYYMVLSWDWQHLFFPNEYIIFSCIQCDQFGGAPDPGR